MMEIPEWFPRFESYISHEALSGCWLWAGEWSDGGYGRLWIRVTQQVRAGIMLRLGYV